jgi:hypothetical protein
MVRLDNSPDLGHTAGTGDHAELTKKPDEVDYMPDADYLEDDELEPEEIEAYCVSCKQKVLMENPMPVWTRRGTPGTRGVCEICGNTVFRMGRTEAHSRIARPDTTQMFGDSAPPRRGKKGQVTDFAAYINYAPADAAIAARIAEDLDKIGIPAWFDPDPGSDQDETIWASGVHPGLAECSHMVVVLSRGALADERVAEEWAYFRQERKPVLVAQAAPCDIPDDLRSRPRFDFSADYKLAFRGLSQALFE